MKRDDPIAQLRLLDPADEKDVDVVVAALAGRDTIDLVVAHVPLKPPRTRRARRPRLALLAVAAAAAAIVATVLANPLSRSGISSAQAKAQVDRALDITGAWHIARVTQMANVKGSATPRYSKGFREDAWHAPDGRLLIRFSDGSGNTDTVLYADGERRTYNTATKRLRVHKFVLVADMRDDERQFLPATAADLYRAAYRVGKVRLAGVETIDGRRVYRLAFDWRGAAYTLIFDAERRVPISSETRVHGGGDNSFVMRVRYTAYQRLRPGPDLDARLALPAIARAAKTVHERPLVIPPPVQGAPAVRVARAVDAISPNATVVVARATYSIVRHLAGGASVSLVLVPGRVSDAKGCVSVIEIAHPGGEARIGGTTCVGAEFSTQSRDGATRFVGGGTKARRIELRFANGVTIRAQVRRGTYLAAFPSALAGRPFSVVTTNRDGSITTRQWPLFGIEFTSAIAG